MSKRFEETDLGRVKPIPIAGRESKVSVGDIVDPVTSFSRELSPESLLEAFPDILAGKSLRRVVSALKQARSDGKEVLWLIGAHTIKCGLTKYMGRLMEAGYITSMSTTGSATIHDLELAFFGKTSEDVAAELPAGRFGMSRETSDHFNAACRHAGETETGLGSGVGSYIAQSDAPNKTSSIFWKAHELGIPATVHVAFGTDITHQHAGFPAASVGESTMRDFRILTHRVGRMFDKGVAVIFGSAVILPEVFLKSVSVNYNLGLEPEGVTAVSFDMLPQYRVKENVLARPFQGKGEAFTLTGHHELMMPLLYYLLGCGSTGQ